MKVFFKSIIRLFPVPAVLMLFASCSYGIFNFAADTGSVELQFRMVTDNYLGVDQIDYELSPPEGLSVNASVDFSGSTEYYNLYNMTAGTWKIHITLYAGGALIQEFDFDFEITADMRTTLWLECGYSSGEYSITTQTWQYSEYDDSSGSGDNTAVAAFTVSDVVIMPSVYEEYYSSGRQYGVDVRIKGAGFEGNLSSLELTYPDGSVYSLGQEYYYSRTVQMFHTIDDVLIDISRNAGGESSVVNGDFTLYLSDYSNVSEKYTETLDSDYDLLVPKITLYSNNSGESGEIIPPTLDSIVEHYFDYEFDSSQGIGTRVVFMINREYQIIMPADDTMLAASDYGTLTAPKSAMEPGDWELIIAAFGHVTSTPFSDAAVAGLYVDDMSSENFASSLFEMYGGDTGFVCYLSVPVTFY